MKAFAYSTTDIERCVVLPALESLERSAAANAGALVSEEHAGLRIGVKKLAGFQRYQYRMNDKVTAFAKVCVAMTAAYERLVDTIADDGSLSFEELPAHASSADPVRCTVLYQCTDKQTVSFGALKSDAVVNALAVILPYDIAFELGAFLLARHEANQAAPVLAAPSFDRRYASEVQAHAAYYASRARYYREAHTDAGIYAAAEIEPFAIDMQQYAAVLAMRQMAIRGLLD